MIRIHGGKLAMGSTDGEDDERPVHPVVVQPFFLDKTEVTVAAYKRCVDAHRCVAPLLIEGCNYGTQGRDLHPVNCVDYEQANTYCKVHGKRLPTEEEWEYAARAEQGKKYPWGNAAPSTQPCWNGEGNSAGKGKRESTCEVGTSPGDKTSSGVLDMAGNVSEWTATVYCQYPIANCTSPVRVTRGGSWTDFGAVTLRSTYRGRQNPADRSGGLGFRCARTP
jgi:formylglycine-generating enzyme required for sulfatase activity